MYIFVLSLALLLMIVHILFMKEKSAGKVIEVCLLYLLFIIFGIGNTMAGLFHIFSGPATAKMIGWAPGSPFQYEVGVADVAFGSLGLLSLFIRGRFWLATIIANSVFLIGCMIGHVHNLAVSGNLAPYNIGPNIFFSDLLMPVIMIVLYYFYFKLSDVKTA